MLMMIQYKETAICYALLPLPKEECHVFAAVFFLSVGKVSEKLQTDFDGIFGRVWLGTGLRNSL